MVVSFIRNLQKDVNKPFFKECNVKMGNSTLKIIAKQDFTNRIFQSHFKSGEIDITVSFFSLESESIVP